MAQMQFHTSPLCLITNHKAILNDRDCEDAEWSPVSYGRNIGYCIRLLGLASDDKIPLAGWVVIGGNYD